MERRDAFLLGDDLALYGAPLPDDACADMKQGYEHGKVRRGTPMEADRFVRKWLQIRVGAWRRDKTFLSEEITPAYLKMIDTPICPVSLVPLTHATGGGTDWSIDRLYNRGGYAHGNLAVLSTRVNTVKGSYDVEDIHRFLNDGTAPATLTSVEWARLGSLMNGACGSNLVFPALIPYELYPISIGMPTATAVQYSYARAVLKHIAKPIRFNNWGSKDAHDAFVKVLRIRVAKMRCGKIHTVFEDLATFKAYCEWAVTLSDEDNESLTRHILSNIDGAMESAGLVSQGPAVKVIDFEQEHRRWGAPVNWGDGATVLGPPTFTDPGNMAD